MLPTPRNSAEHSLRAHRCEKRWPSSLKLPWSNADALLRLLVGSSRLTRADLRATVRLSGETEAGSAGTQLRQGISGPRCAKAHAGSGGYASSGACSFLLPLDTLPYLRKSAERSSAYAFCRCFFWFFLTRRAPRRECLTVGENSRRASKGSSSTPKTCRPRASFRITATRARVPPFSR